MKILLLGFGSRGDVQPILPLAQGLQDAGYAVQIGAGQDFRGWITARGFDFVDLGVDMYQLLQSEAGKQWVENSAHPIQEARHMKAVLDTHSDIVSDAILAAGAHADALISGIPTFGAAQAVAEKLGKRHLRVMLAPLTPSVYAESTMIPIVRGRKTRLNLLSNYGGIYYLYWINRESVNRFRRRLGLAPWGFGDFARAWNRMPVIYGVSQAMMPRDERWRPDTVVTGFWFDTPNATWQPPDALARFLQSHPNPVYLGFGSMSARNPQTTLGLMTDALRQTGQAGIILSGWAGLEQGPLDAQLPDNVLIIDGAPHDWLFPRMAALIHHGGAGTTATGVRAGVPATVVSHMADQPYWGRRLYELGVGERAIRRQALTATGLAAAIDSMLTDPHMRTRAAKLAAQINREQGVDNAVAAIRTSLQTG